MTETTSEAPKRPLKRALFNKPAWSRPQNLASPTDFFHRGNSAHVDPVAELEQKRKAKAARKEAEKARQQAEAQPAEKRRRISCEDDDDLYGASDRDEKLHRPSPSRPETKSATLNKGTTTEAQSHVKHEPSPKSLAKRYDEKITTKMENDAKPKPPSVDIIDLDESDEVEEEDLRVTQTTKPPPPDDDDFPASDDEYAELVRKAREKARRKRLEDDIIPSKQKQAFSVEPESRPQTSSSGNTSTARSALDPEVEILITSRLENAIPLIIRRRISQRLKDVRITWCDKNQFSPDMTESIFLTWRGKRLFDVTSCKSLGIAVDEDGRVRARGQDDVMIDEDRKVHMEAMTETLYEEYQEAKRRATEPKNEDEEKEQAPVQQKPSESQVRIILKAKGFADFKLIAKPVSVSHVCLSLDVLTDSCDSRLKSQRWLLLSGKQILVGLKIKRSTSFLMEIA